MTPLEIQNHHFSRRLSGIDPEEVASFLKIVADDYESALRENERLKDTVHQLEKRNDELADGEKVLRETLVSAQSMAEKLRETAVAESEVLLQTAELRAEKILDASHRRAATLADEIQELRGLRKRYASSLRSMIDTHLGLIERLEQDDVEPVAHLTGIIRKYRNPDLDETQGANGTTETDKAAKAVTDEARATHSNDPDRSAPRTSQDTQPPASRGEGPAEPTTSPVPYTPASPF